MGQTDRGECVLKHENSALTPTAQRSKRALWRFVYRIAGHVEPVSFPNSAKEVRRRDPLTLGRTGVFLWRDAPRSM